MKRFYFFFAVVLLITIVSAFPRHARCAEPGEIIEACGIHGGLAVVVGCEDPALPAGLESDGSFVVCGLEPDAEKASKARSFLREKGVYGAVTVSILKGRQLPLVDGTANMIILTRGDIDIPADEIRRALAPGGVVVDIRNSKIETTRKAWPDEIDGWPHFLYDASNNAVSEDTVVAPPRGLQWTCGPRYARSHEHFGSVSAMVSSGGRVFSIQDSGPISSVLLPPKWELLARDAFNGVLLWKVPVKSWESQLRGFRSGPPEIGRRLVAAGDRVYVALNYGDPVTVLDAATGEEVDTLAGSEGARELLYTDGRLYVLADDMTREDHESRRKWFKEKASTKTYRFPKEPLSMYGRQRIVAFAGESGKQLWCNKEQRPAGEIMPATMAVSGGKVCFQTTSHVVCLDGGSGKEQWRSERPVATSRFSWATPTLVIHDGAVISGDRMAKDNIGDEPEKGSRWIMDNHHQMRKQPGEIVAFSMKDGSELWRAPAFENYTIPMDIFVIDDTVWVGHIRSKRYPGFTKGRDLMTGKVTSKIPDNGKLYDLQMGHNRCYRNKATCRFLILGRDGVEFVDPKKGTGNGNWWVRGTCQYGVMPANGLLYVPIHSCACHPTEELKGFNTLSPNSSADGSIDEAGRLDKGPAYGTKPGKTDPAASDWPTYRRDAGRSGYQGIDAPDDPATAWTAECSPPITAPVSAGGRVYVAETDKHAVRVFDAQDGKPLWTFIAEGRIDSPPTIVGGLCLFGTRNGFVYCLRAEDGKPAWRFRAAPRDRLLFSHEQTESVWPVHGSVLVDRTAAASSPVVYFAAGRSSHLDGGIRLYALDIATGEEVRTATVAMASDADGVIKARALPDVLSLQDGSIYMRNLRFDRQLKRQKGNVRHLYAPAGFLDTTWWHRTYWVFGTNMRSAYGGWPRVGNVTPAGRLLVCDGGDLIYGYGRLSYRAGAGHVNPDATKDYKVFAEVRSPETKADARKRRRRGGGRRELTWSESLPFITRAMVLSRDALIVAGGQSLPGASGDNGPGIFSIVSRKDGARGAECALPAAPVLDGMALTGSGVFVATIDGKVVCLR